MPFSNKRNQHALEKWLVLGPAQEVGKMSLEHLRVPESNSVLKKQKQRSHNDEIKRDRGDNGNSFHMAKIGII